MGRKAASLFLSSVLVVASLGLLCAHCLAALGKSAPTHDCCPPAPDDPGKSHDSSRQGGECRHQLFAQASSANLQVEGAGAAAPVAVLAAQTPRLPLSQVPRHPGTAFQQPRENAPPDLYLLNATLLI